MRHDQIPTGPLTLQQASDAAARFGLDMGADFERVAVPLAECPDAERTRVAKWAALRGGPLPSSTWAYRVRASRLQTSLFAGRAAGEDYHAPAE